MAQSLIWSEEALDDIDRIAEYIGRDSPYHAQQVVEHLFDLAGELPEHPELGRIVPELADPKVRERFLYSYRLIYEMSDGEIHILAVIHGRRLLESLDRFSD
jgi:plasmid stabilization system protein ParE